MMLPKFPTDFYGKKLKSFTANSNCEWVFEFEDGSVLEITAYDNPRQGVGVEIDYEVLKGPTDRLSD